MTTQIINGTVLLPSGKWLENGSVLIEDSTIRSIATNNEWQADTVIDAAGGYVMPGGIDLHVHGGGGSDFMEATREAFVNAAEAHRRHGTTSIMPTMASSTVESMHRAAEVCDELIADPHSGIIGLHFEGPYFAPAMAGGQIPENIHMPDAEEYRFFIERYNSIKRWDASPELPGALEFASYMSSKGVVAGLAHTAATARQVEDGFNAGFSLATHFFNAMTTSHKVGPYKHEGTVEGVLLIDDFDVEVIADGIHVPAPMLKLLYKIKGAGHICLVTDAQACSASDTDKAFDPRVVIYNGVCMLADHSAIAGSCATMDRLIRTYVLDAGVPLCEVSRMASETPARVMGIFDRKGSLAPGKDADIMIMDKNINLTHVIMMGKEVDLTAGT